MPALSTQRYSREICPPGFRPWVDNAPANELEVFRRTVEDFKNHVDAANDLFKEHVYDNLEAKQSDFRQHQFMLAGLISFGGELAVKMLTQLPNSKERQELVANTDEIVKSLVATFCEWHAPIESDTSLPESFRSGLAEAMAGKTVPFGDL